MKTLKILRSIVGDTQLDVQRKTKIPDWKLSLFEAGYKTPDSAELLALSKAFEVSPETLQSTITIQNGRVVVT